MKTGDMRISFSFSETPEELTPILEKLPKQCKVTISNINVCTRKKGWNRWFYLGPIDKEGSLKTRENIEKIIYSLKPKHLQRLEAVINELEGLVVNNPHWDDDR